MTFIQWSLSSFLVFRQSMCKARAPIFRSIYVCVFTCYSRERVIHACCAYQVYIYLVPPGIMIHAINIYQGYNDTWYDTWVQTQIRLESELALTDTSKELCSVPLLSEVKTKYLNVWKTKQILKHIIPPGVCTRYHTRYQEHVGTYKKILPACFLLAAAAVTVCCSLLLQCLARYYLVPK